MFSGLAATERGAGDDASGLHPHAEFTDLFEAAARWEDGFQFR